MAPHPTSILAAAKPVKKLTRFLSPIRSLDVSAALLDQRLQALPPESRRSLRAAVSALRDLRREARKRLTKSSRKIRNSLRDTAVAASKLPSSAPWFLPSLRRQVLAARRSALGALAAYRRSPNMHRLHELRIRLKKYRYLVEVRADALRTPEPSLDTLKALQDGIGEIHDLEVLRQLLQDREVTRRISGEKSRRALAGFAAGLATEAEALEQGFLRRERRRLHSLFPREVP